LLYTKSLTVPANTPSTSPKEDTIVIKHPVVTRLGVLFPAGCHALVRVAIFYGKLQIWPHKEGEWLQGDDVVIWDEPFFELPEKETTLRLVGWNEDDGYAHTPIFYIVAHERAIALWMATLSRLVSLFEKFLRVVGLIR